MPVLLFCFHVLGLAPLLVLHILGGILGIFVYLCSARYRQRIAENLTYAQLNTFKHRFISAIHAGCAVLELSKVWFHGNRACRNVKVYGWDSVASLLAQGKGVIFLTPHLGCFEITAQFIARLTPITVMYRPARKAWLRPLLEKGRTQAQVKLASADLKGVRILAKALKRGESVGILPDQVPSNGEGLWLPFFGKPAYTMTLPAKLHEMTDAPIVSVVGIRKSWGRGWEMHFTPLGLGRTRQPLLPDEEISERHQRSTTLLTLAINQNMETLIRKVPEQYLWGYNRYKTPKKITKPIAQEISGATSSQQDEV